MDFLQTCSTNAALLSYHPPYRSESQGYWFVRLIKERIRCYCNYFITTFALYPFSGQQPIFRIVTFITLITSWPFSLYQVFSTTLFRRKDFVKFHLISWIPHGHIDTT